MLQTAAYQPVEMAFLKSSTNGDTYLNAPGRTLRGRNGYESLGALRTKPGRADSIPSICMSCSDKIASWSTLGMQGALLAGCFDPVWIGHVVVGGVEEVPPEGARLEEGIGWRAKIKKELERALYGRLTSLQGLPFVEILFVIERSNRTPTIAVSTTPTRDSPDVSHLPIF